MTKKHKSIPSEETVDQNPIVVTEEAPKAKKASGVLKVVHSFWVKNYGRFTLGDVVNPKTYAGLKRVLKNIDKYIK